MLSSVYNTQAVKQSDTLTLLSAVGLRELSRLSQQVSAYQITLSSISRMAAAAGTVLSRKP